MAKNEAKIKFTAETKDFNKQIKASNDELSELRAELKLNETQMKGAGTSVEGLENKHKILSSQLEASKRKTEALSEKVEKAVEIFGENSTEATKLKTQLLNAQTAEEKLRQAVDSCSRELEDQKAAADKTETATEKLTGTIERQQKELDQLKRDYVDVALEYGETSDEAKQLERSISDLSGELKQNKSALEDAADKADKLDKSLDDASESSGGATGGFTTLKATVADLASSAIQAAIGKIKEFISYLAELPEATREFRQDLATLTTSFDNMGFSTETAKDTWKELYAIFGEDDRAVETANHISKMADNQKDLNKWVTITTGVFATYQDSLPVEGLAEASNETAKTGQVTGVLADALNWSTEAATMFADYMSEDVVTAEDAFNEALKECTTEEERQALITDTLSKLYGDAAETYRETAASQMEAKEATAEHTLVQSEMAEAIEPVTTAWQTLKTEALEALLPVIQTVCEFLTENEAVLKVVSAAIIVLSVALGALVALLAWALAVSPFGQIVIGISLLIAFWDELVALLKSGWEWIKATFSTIGAWINTNVVQPVVQFFTELWQKLKSIWDTICNVIQVAFMFIGSIISAAFQIITLPFRFIWENCKEYVFSAFEWIKEKISSAIEFLKNLVSVGFTFIKEKIINPITTAKNKAVEIFTKIRTSVSEKITALRSKVSQIFNSIKEKIMTPINNAKAKAVSIIESLRSSFSSKIESLRSKVSSIFSSIKDKITQPIETAKSKVKSMVDSIQGFFSRMKISLPHIKLPHFKVTGKLSINPPSVPKLSISWYKDGAIFAKPTLFNTPFGMKGVGEAGAEAVLPIEKLKDYIADTVEEKMNVVNLGALADAIERLADRDINLNINGRRFAEATAGDSDRVNGLRSSFRTRGLALD